MSTLALEIDQTLQQLDAARASRLEQKVRALILRMKVGAPVNPVAKRRQWLLRLDHLRSSVGTGKAGTSSEAIIEDIRSERD